MLILLGEHRIITHREEGPEHLQLCLLSGHEVLERLPLVSRQEVVYLDLLYFWSFLILEAIRRVHHHVVLLIFVLERRLLAGVLVLPGRARDRGAVEGVSRVGRLTLGDHVRVRKVCNALHRFHTQQFWTRVLDKLLSIFNFDVLGHIVNQLLPLGMRLASQICIDERFLATGLLAEHGQFDLGIVLLATWPFVWQDAANVLPLLVLLSHRLLDVADGTEMMKVLLEAQLFVNFTSFIIVCFLRSAEGRFEAIALVLLVEILLVPRRLLNELLV